MSVQASAGTTASICIFLQEAVGNPASTANLENMTPTRISVVEQASAVQDHGDIRSFGSLDKCLKKDPFAELVLQAVHRVDETSLRPVAPVGAGIAFEPRALLALVTYYYAVGVYASQDIENLMCEDPTFRSLCQNEFPRWQAIRRFRRRNRQPIERCLTEVLGATESGAPGVVIERDGVPQRLGTPWDHATERIARAIFMDSMTNED